MKTNINRIISIPILILTVIISGNIFGQDSLQHSMQLLDLKLKLLDSKLQLLDSKYMDSKLHVLNLKLEQFKTKPNLQNIKLQQLDSALQSLNTKSEIIVTDTTTIKPFKTSIKLNPCRLFEGTLQLSYERAINDFWSIDISGLATYVTKGGMGNMYLKKQELLAFDKESNSYYSYNGKMITGWGIIIQAKNFLLPKINTKNKAPIGLYAAPQLMYRKIWITGITNEWTDITWIEKEVKRNLDVYSCGAILGGKFPFLKVLCIDIYVGGVLRLSKYSNESSPTKYKRWNNIDYSGILPTAGINIGILK